jgi:hypothetical protein
MKIFEWMKDIEKVYNDLIEKAKEENLIEIQNFRKEQEKILEVYLQKKQNIVKNILSSLNTETNEGVKVFKEDIKSKLEAVKASYENEKKNLLDKIITKIGLDFNV